MRLLGPVIVLLSASQIAQPAAERHPYRDQYVTRTFSKEATVRVVGGAGIQTARNSPHEWGRSVGGLGKRVGSALGQHLVKNTIQFGVASARHEELGYRPSGKRGFGPRLKYALVS